MARTAKEDELPQLEQPTKVRVKHFMTKKYNGGHTARLPAISVNPEQVYDIADFENIKAALELEGIETEEVERF